MVEFIFAVNYVNRKFHEMMKTKNKDYYIMRTTLCAITIFNKFVIILKNDQCNEQCMHFANASDEE